MDGLSETISDDAICVTPSIPLLELAALFVSPEYVAVTLWNPFATADGVYCTAHWLL